MYLWFRYIKFRTTNKVDDTFLRKLVLRQSIKTEVRKSTIYVAHVHCVESNYKRAV